MILIEHSNGIVHSVSHNGSELTGYVGKHASKSLLELASVYPAEIICWKSMHLPGVVHEDDLVALFNNRREILSYNTGDKSCLTDSIGYVEDTPFLKVPQDVRYPTWILSSCIGAAYGELLNLFSAISTDRNFDYFLCSLGKLGQPQGMLCYSEPALIKGQAGFEVKKFSKPKLFKFVAQHYRKRWTWLLFLNLLIYEGRFQIFSWLGSLFVSRRNIDINIDKIELSPGHMQMDEIDVIIPTIGRRDYLLQVLQDLATQTHLPQKVVIVEQCADPEGTSELDYIEQNQWPFTIDHIFTHKLGVCNARNMAISRTSAPWLFFADDDNRLSPNLISEVLKLAGSLGADVLTTSYLQEQEIKQHHEIKQWPTFGAGNSFVKGELARRIEFDVAMEHGYGEDKDYGMKLRNSGHDVLYTPIEILHLKAPIGGFRKKFNHPWESEKIQPKPSPTIMYLRMKYSSAKQLLGYKTMLFFKFYREQSIKNPFKYLRRFKDGWTQSVKWAAKLNKLS